MPNISDFNIASGPATDREHDVQLGLLQALCRAVADNRDAASVSEILDQLIAYSESHFMSEELMMRLNSHGDYADHVDDHGHMLDVLRQIAAAHAAGNSPLLAAKVAEFLVSSAVTSTRVIGTSPSACARGSSAVAGRGFRYLSSWRGVRMAAR